MHPILTQIKNGLIVSCQALPHEPLHSPFIMGRMALAAKEGGAVGIRANSVADIVEIKSQVDLPIIGIIKADYPGSEVYITPTMVEVDALAAAGCHIIATDATNSTYRPRPGGQSLDDFFKAARAKYPHQLFMADCATYEEGIHAAQLGFDMVGTTLSGYTAQSQGAPAPNFHMMSGLVYNAGVPIIAEGNIWSVEDLRLAKNCGVHAAVVGSVITRPQLITRNFAEVMKCPPTK